MGQADHAAVRLTVRDEGADADGVLLSIIGELDVDGVETAREHIEQVLRSGPRRLCLDLGQLGFCDSSGLNLLLRLRAQAEQVGTRLILAAPCGAVRRLLELTGADTVFEVQEQVGSAVASR